MKVVETLETFLQCSQKRHLLFKNNFTHVNFLLFQFRKHVLELIGDEMYEFVQERFFEIQEGKTIAYGATKDASYDITGPGIGRQLAVSDGEGNSPYVVRDRKSTRLNSSHVKIS